MDIAKYRVGVLLAVCLLAGIFMFGNRYKSPHGTIAPVSSNMQGGLPQEPVDRVAFLNEIFKDIKPTDQVYRLLQTDPRQAPDDSLQVILKWAEETGIVPLAIMVQTDLTLKHPTEENITSAARALVQGGSEYRDIPVVSAWMFQQSKILIDKGMAMNDRNVPLRNALITYISEYENQPMKFLGVLRETLAIDSNNAETHYIHLKLLMKSGQWKKAINKCEKLVSLQPQNPMWLFHLSEIYGNMGDSLSARTYLNLAVKANKEQQETEK